MESILEFEKPIVLLDKKLQELRELTKAEGVDFTHEIKVLEKKLHSLIDDIFARLTPWQRVHLSRHPNRPYARDYIESLFPDFMELGGDRAFGDDQAIVAGTATWNKKQPIVIIGNQKGRTTKQKIDRNFGMARPEGYRKALRLMDLADRFRMPIVTFIDTPGAYPGIDAEERGQSQAIAESIRRAFGVRAPIVCVVIGEGGSGGALAIGVGDRVLMQEYSIYSV
ncbi:MAG: acetyl-CoA carboxylase carboxyl transferase subunit alpha, partial [Bdellovibrionota bacterium]